MPSKTSDTDRDNIIQKYRAGVSGKDIATEFGVSTVTVYNILRQAGIELTGRIGKTLPNAEILTAFNHGRTPAELAAKYGVSDSVITTILRNAGINSARTRLASAIVRDLNITGASDTDVLKLFNSGIGVRGIHEKLGISLRAAAAILNRNGIDIRNRSEQQFARMARTDADGRAALVAAANLATRGKPAIPQRLAQGAATAEARGSRRQSPYEILLGSMLLDRGISFTPQKAFGPYNCDLAATPVAVEIFGGKWHWYGDHLARCEKRTNYILNAGWHVLMVAVNEAFPLTPAVADYIAAYINSARSNPSIAREYRVIWGACEFTTAGGPNDNHFSIKPPFTNTRDATTGQYKRVRR